MRIINKHITLDEIGIIRNSLDKLHEYHNSKSKFFSGDYPRITFEERIEEYKKIQSMENTELNY
ncbi:putative acetyltransferase, GNAT [Bacillus pseudomycoides]|nr:putative acetyltransferase, GNAT [Bacillus pseudomycoides]